jgi:5'-3' exonuclease
LGVSEASFHKGAPFLPFQQLLGCLPAASMQFLPAKYQWLMTDPASPLLDFFPADFKVWWGHAHCIRAEPSTGKLSIYFEVSN